mmetsp:Transcript_18168/g.28969  ORF Transcript_18168/g.28969 Transcript_18168/m.28969 type:complete len:83 (+) Transcript_18168:374-622(+)
MPRVQIKLKADGRSGIANATHGPLRIRCASFRQERQGWLHDMKFLMEEHLPVLIPSYLLITPAKKVGKLIDKMVIQVIREKT